jgi:hypothetical protein
VTRLAGGIVVPVEAVQRVAIPTEPDLVDGQHHDRTARGLGLAQLVPGDEPDVGWAIALDALEHDGPANLERILDGNSPGSSPVCAETVMPGVDPSTLAGNLAAYDLAVATALGDGAHLTEEPPLACYARGKGPRR